jgi:hypothetical protein
VGEKLMFENSVRVDIRKTPSGTVISDARYLHLTTTFFKNLCGCNGFEIIKLHGGSFGSTLFGKQIARIWPWHSMYCTVKIQKMIEDTQ